MKHPRTEYEDDFQIMLTKETYLLFSRVDMPIHLDQIIAIMKTSLESPKMSNGLYHLVLILLTGLCSINVTIGQEIKSNHYDYLMPEKGKSMLEFYTGIPYVAIGGYSYGFSEKFSAGIIYGYTPHVLGYGVRIKAIIAQPNESMRIYFKSPLIYYPKMSPEVADPWVLAYPSLNIEWKFKNEGRLWTGVGVIGAACVDYLLGSEEEEEIAKHGPRTGPEMMKKEPVAELMNTIQIGYSKPLSNRTSFVIEVAPLMKGFKFVTPHGLINGLPAAVTLGLTLSL